MKALRSVLEQSFEDSELIVVDGGTAEMVATITDERVPAVEARRRPAPDADVRR